MKKEIPLQLVGLIILASELKGERPMKNVTEKILTETSFQGCTPSVVVSEGGLV
ncbi:MAG: hypothetical protein QGG48_14165 [Desulfatiglandales bacterium]|nr:hypothetical protein [Desulfatiglandales bacterium]